MNSYREFTRGFRAIKRKSMYMLIFTIFFFLVVFCSSCGNESREIRGYLDLANRVLSQLTTGLVELRNALFLPLDRQEKTENKLALFRKIIARSRSKIDRFQTPEPCMGLEDLLRKCIGEAADIAQVSSLFVDYLKSAARIAREVAGLITQIEGLKDEEASYAIVVGMEDRANKLSAEARSMIVSNVFRPAHEILSTYAFELADAITKTAKRIRKSYYGLGTTGQSSQENIEDNPSSYAGIFSTLKMVSGKWQKRVQEIGAIIESLKVSSGYQKENAEFDNAVLSTQAEIGKLEKEWKKSWSKS